MPSFSHEFSHSFTHPLVQLSTDLRMMYYSVSDTGVCTRKREIRVLLSGVDLPITSSDALPLSYMRLVGAKAIKLGSWDKHPAYC